MTEIIDILFNEENILSLLRGGLRIFLIVLIAKIVFSLINKRLRVRLERVQESTDKSREGDKILTLIPIIHIPFIKFLL